MAYTPDSIWRNRDTFVKGRAEIEQFLTDKWNREHKYILRKELFAFDNDKVSLPGYSSRRVSLAYPAFHIRFYFNPSFRLLSNFGMNFMTMMVSGGDAMDSRIGPSTRTD